MRIRETRTVGGGMGGGRVEDRVSVVAKDAHAPITAQVVPDDTPTHDWQEVSSVSDPHVTQAVNLPPALPVGEPVEPVSAGPAASAPPAPGG